MYLVDSLRWEISIIGLSLTVFTLINLLSKSYKHKSDLLLCIWLVLLNIPLVHNVLSHLDVNFPTFRLLTNPTLNLLYGPILYLYVKMLISSDSGLIRRSTLLHLIPFATYYLLFISMAHPKPMTPFPNEPNVDIGPVGEGGVTSFFEPLLANFGWISAVIFIAYSIVTIYELLKHQKNIAEIFSQNNNQISLKWLYALPAIFVVLVLLNFVNENALDSTTIVDPQTFHMLSFLSFIILLCFFGVKQKPVFSFPGRSADIEKTPEIPLDALDSEAITKTDSSENEDAHSDMSDEAIAQTIEAMQAYMTDEKPYLNPDFSVYDLAAALNTPRRTLSQVINSQLSKNFYQLVNEFRIEEVKALLESQEHRQSTILDIAFQSGFKSKSSFNSLFKQYCDMTPSQYRKSIGQAKN